MTLSNSLTLVFSESAPVVFDVIFASSVHCYCVVIILARTCNIYVLAFGKS